MRFEVSGTRPETAVRDLGGIYAGERWSAAPSNGRFDYRYTAIGDSEVTIRRSQMHGEIRGYMPGGAPDHVVTWISTGTGEVEVRGERWPMLHDVPVLFPADEEFTFTTADYDQRLVHLDRGFVGRVAATRSEIGERPLRFDARRGADENLGHRWQGALTALSRALRVGGPDSDVWQDAKVAAAEVFLDMFPPQSDDLPDVLAQPRNARLRAAVEYIHAHAAEDVSIVDLSEAAGLSVRSVQESFRRVFDVSPLTYLRQVRLDRVHEELLEAGPQAGAVGEVARRWGFAHLGRFSASYAERFGEYPKQTLRR
ncbi:hypothetical protein DEJ23_09150 [Curtobacterium sp. MCSS17_008]|nr:hypothetical protein DEJ23_09150 [Curtobacterium sp. MCSS17_008]